MLRTKIFLALALLLFSASAFALPCALEKVDVSYFIDGTQVFHNETITTENNSFEYKIHIENNTGCEKTIRVLQVISNKFSMDSAHSYSQTMGGKNNKFLFDSITLGSGEAYDLTMTFTNETGEEIETFAFTTNFEGHCGHPCHFQFFLIKLHVPEIPEFGFLLIPLGIALGSFFIIRRKQSA